MEHAQVEVLNAPIDVSTEFARLENEYFIAGKTMSFDAASGTGFLEWVRHALRVRTSFDQVTLPLEQTEGWEFPPAYGPDMPLPFAIEFITPRTVRLRMATRQVPRPAQPSLMLVGEPPHDDSWAVTTEEDRVVYQSACGRVEVTLNPWRLAIYDADGRQLTATNGLGDCLCLTNSYPQPFSFVRRAADQQRHIAASFRLAPDEMLFGGGESFTRLNKRGQRLVLFTTDAHGAQRREMYKPVPFFLSSRGYGMFVHTSAPLTFDFGCSYDGVNTLYLGDDTLDLFIFFGTPQQILGEYTALTGRSPMPPLWSFGLWMSRITYKAEAEVREVAARLREERIPCDVLHLDTGWFETDWQCDYRFSPSRFTDPAQMIADLMRDGFRVSLWQLPYFTPKNRLFPEIVERGLAVRTADGALPTEDAILDFSNPAAVDWYQGQLAGLFAMGVGAIKVDFGEAAPVYGQYASGQSGFYEHNLYPLRYNKAVADITLQKMGEHIIWARSAWAGSQRYPLHWGGDAENTDTAMAATLRAGLSLGLCGFTFWSHDIGGFVRHAPEEIYRRWLPFGLLTSHSRCHGAPPKEPWFYGEAFTALFRKAVELKYCLMPYIYAQAAVCAERGFPMMQALFFADPQDRVCWGIEDEYLFGSDLLVAPLLEEGARERDVYLPPGIWVDFQTGELYEGERWHRIAAGDIPIVLLVRNGAAIPIAAAAQSTAGLDWSRQDLVVFASGVDRATAKVCLPQEGAVHDLVLAHTAQGWELEEDPMAGRVRWAIRSFRTAGKGPRPGEE